MPSSEGLLNEMEPFLFGSLRLGLGQKLIYSLNAMISIGNQKVDATVYRNNI